jgi:hypothetical protein
MERFPAAVFQKLKLAVRAHPQDRSLGSPGKSAHRAAGFERGFWDASVVGSKRPMEEDRGRHTELLGGSPDREALGTKLHGAHKIHLRLRTADVLALPAGALLASPTAGSDLPPLFLGHPGEDGDEQLPDRAAHVEPGFPHANDLYAEAIQGEHLLEVANEGAPQPIQGEDQDRIELALVGGGLEPLPLGPVLYGRDILLEDLDDREATSLGKLHHGGSLVVGVAPLGAAPEVDTGSAASVMIGSVPKARSHPSGTTGPGSE